MAARCCASRLMFTLTCLSASSLCFASCSSTPRSLKSTSRALLPGLAGSPPLCPPAGKYSSLCATVALSTFMFPKSSAISSPCQSPMHLSLSTLLRNEMNALPVPTPVSLFLPNFTPTAMFSCQIFSLKMFPEFACSPLYPHMVEMSTAYVLSTCRCRSARLSSTRSPPS